MSQPAWSIQKDTPLFPDLLWSRPENRRFAGRLLLVGGTVQSFAGTAEAFSTAERAGIGTVRTILPQSLAATVGKLFPEAEFVPATPSGSLAVSALAALLEGATWAEGVMIAGDTGNNSETTRLFESFLGKYAGLLTVCGTVIDTMTLTPATLIDRPLTTLVMNFDQLQRLALAAHYPAAFTSTMALLQFVEKLADFSAQHTAHYIVIFQQSVIIAAEGKISSTPLATPTATSNAVAAAATTWWLQNPSQPFAALTTSLYAHQNKQP